MSTSIPQKSTPVTIFNTFFCVLWRKDPAKVIGKFDPYSNRFSLIPVYEGYHWFLVVLCNMDLWVDSSEVKDSSQRPFVTVLDSLEGCCQQENIKIIVEYLTIEAKCRISTPHTPEPRIVTAKEDEEPAISDMRVHIQEVIQRRYDMMPSNEPAASEPATVPADPTDSRVIETRSRKGKEKAMPEVVISPPVK
ncbi:hypothetical protein BC938DRAFT_478585 [Jimgerdemannia flammicorona]|uniref:Ubiquitin-like protease family profile domain-containing protein n=1 Tax=Jimgerdemannia flammicorona TaxID=994334 RepID=A0A433QYF7_9FUNG|nr:hypothetical protein BC938DRAFT_478585 [Jimgerdemannia flammicorona]